VSGFVVWKAWIQARLARDDRGSNLVEYILLISLIAVAVMGAVAYLGSQLSPKYNGAGSQLSVASGP
jgi:Flp pilus assembly pilin Flp